MEAVYYLLPLSLLLAGGGFLAYFWALRGGQFDDLDTPQMRMLFDEEEQSPPPKSDPTSDHEDRP